MILILKKKILQPAPPYSNGGPLAAYLTALTVTECYARYIAYCVKNNVSDTPSTGTSVADWPIPGADPGFWKGWGGGGVGDKLAVRSLHGVRPWGVWRHVP